MLRASGLEEPGLAAVHGSPPCLPCRSHVLLLVSFQDSEVIKKAQREKQPCDENVFFIFFNADPSQKSNNMQRIEMHKVVCQFSTRRPFDCAVF